MSDQEKRFHEQWLGMVQPSEGLVVSVPVLCDAQCMEKLPRELHVRFLEHLVDGRIVDLRGVLADVLELDASRFDDDPPREVSLYVPEGKQLLRPTRALRGARPAEPSGAESTPASIAAAPYVMLLWEVPADVENLDKPETKTGSWDYPAQAKFERLLRECRVPIGLLSNGRELRLVYAPHGESSGWIAFRVEDMASVSGRPIFDAFVMLLSRQRWFGVAPEHQLPAILAESRRRNADVTNDLSRQVFEALEVLLAGFSAADERDGKGLLRDALERDDEHLYAGLLTVLLRLVFLLYCEDRALLPVEEELFAENYSLLGLFEQLQADHGRYPDTMNRRFGAWPRLVSLFRAVFLGVRHGDLRIPARRGELFDPNAYPFLEGWGPDGGAPIAEPEARAAVVVPSVDDHTVFTVLHKLLYLGGQRLSYKALDVEQIGSVYEALMGFRIERLEHAAVRIKLGSKRGAARVWVEPATVLAVAKNQRQSHLEDELGFDKAVAKKIHDSLEKALADAKEPVAALEPLSGRVPERAAAGTLVVQPGPERRRTSSHYTPRELTEPIVARTLEPLIKAMGDAPSSKTLLDLVICDPAMGSGAFLVAACRYLADHLVAAWTREGALEKIADAHDDVVNHARRLVAQRCLYGVDKNPYAVRLARLSLWLVTMAREEPFTFVDHALRHGDSLVGLSFDQLRAFHWKPGAQVEISAGLLRDALDEAIAIRRQILDLAEEGTFAAQQQKEWLLWNANDLLDRVRLIGDLVVGAFFAHGKDKDREKERDRRLALVERWLAAEKRGDDGTAGSVQEELRTMQAELRKTQVPFHWMIEFPEVFTAARRDPLDGNRVNGAAYVEAFVGNPPFAGKNGISAMGGTEYLPWLLALHEGSHGNADYCAHFFRRAASLVGDHGTIGFIATNTIGQGDTRSTGLQHLVERGFKVYATITNLAWPGEAAVTVSVAHLAVGAASPADSWLDGQKVSAIDSGLRAGAERKDAVTLKANESCSFQGSVVLGMGFTLTPEERERLVAKDARNAERIFPYLGGQEVNTSPTQSFDRYVISFGQMEFDETERWPDLLAIVREKVKPERDKNNREVRRRYWWRFGEVAPALYQAIAPISRCLVCAIVSKHLMFSFQPTDRIFSHKLYVFPIERFTGFSVLQSRVHDSWAWLLSSTMRNAGINYSASDCFETFPFPHENPRDVLPDLEAIGERLYEARAKYMVEENVGLTKTYNALKDPACDDPRILALRTLHEDMDRAVLAAYGWSDLAVPPYCPRDDVDRAALKSFEEAVIDRLFGLNAERTEKERASAPAPKPKRPAKKTATKKSAKGPALPGFEDE